MASFNKRKPKTVADVIDELTYFHYRYNRLRSPQISPESWAKVFENSDINLLEAKFQEEQNIKREV